MGAGQIPIKLSKESAINGAVGKVGMGKEKVLENVNSFIEQLRDNLRPKGAKGRFFLGAHVSTSKGRGIKVLIEHTAPWKRPKGKALFEQAQRELAAREAKAQQEA